MVELIDVKERKVECLIEGNGEKTVVIMPGMGCSIYDWMDIAHEVSQHAKVIAVHRPGVGNSEPHAEGSNTRIASEDLQDLLLELGVEGKVILVGHSYGGLCVQHYARLHSERVESVLLVESASMNRGSRFDELETPVSNETSSDEVFLKQWTAYSKLTKEQLKEKVKPQLSGKELELPAGIQKELLEFYVRPEIYRTQISELLDMRSGAAAMKDAGGFPDCPLTILVADPEYSANEMVEEGMPRIEAERIMQLLQELSFGLKELSSRSELRIIKNSNHSMNETRPDAVVDAIKEMADG